MILAESNKRFRAPGCKFAYMQAFQKLLSIENWEIPMDLQLGRYRSTVTQKS